MTDPTSLTLAQARDLLRRKQISAAELTDAHLAAVEAADKARINRDDPANDKTLSPFFCSPADK